MEPGGVSLELHPFALNGNLTMLIRSQPATPPCHGDKWEAQGHMLMLINQTLCCARSQYAFCTCDQITHIQKVFNFLVTQRGYNMHQSTWEWRVGCCLFCIITLSKLLALEAPKEEKYFYSSLGDNWYFVLTITEIVALWCLKNLMHFLGK